MSVARTNWHSGSLPTLEMEDPFEVPVESVGQAIDLSEPTARLDVRLIELMHREGRLDAAGVTCELKGRPDVVCALCPACEAGDAESALGELCGVSRELESVVTQLAVVGRETKTQPSR